MWITSWRGFLLRKIIFIFMSVSLSTWIFTIIKSDHRSGKLLKADLPNVTLVMAYFNLGDYYKEAVQNTRTKAHYMKWVEFYMWVENPMVIFSDDADFLDKIRVLRRNFSDRTLIFNVSEQEPLWAFNLEHAIEKVFSIPGYPKFHPETVMARYSCAMHAKYELVARVVEMDPFKTPYFAWSDVGVFRDVNTQGRYYRVSPPPLFDDTRVAMAKVNDICEKCTQKDIIQYGYVTLAGSFLLGRGSSMTRFYQKYRMFTEMFIAHKTMGTDELIFSMMWLPHNRPHIELELQLYSAKEYCNRWFYLGLLTIQELCPKLKIIEFV